MKIRYLFPILVVIYGISNFCEADEKAQKHEAITIEDVIAAEKLIDLQFTEEEQKLMLGGLDGNREKYQRLRELSIENSVPPAFQFNPVPAGMQFEREQKPFQMGPVRNGYLPDNVDELAFYSVRDLAELIRVGRVTSTDLTIMYLDRLKKYGPKLECVVTLTEELAMKQARRADEEIAAGHYRGPLHGIPYGAKDLLAVKGYKTTWGAIPYKDQVIEEDATVIQRLEEAGAVLVAKLTLGALAWGDVWYGGKTRNPWNLEQGSSGSSAGSGAATSAGLVAFAIGTETWGSIISPSTRCGVTGLRPTYGRVSRAGAMALSWTMDKIGPICRTVEDCAIVLDAIYGPDSIDRTVMDVPFNYKPGVDWTDLRIGYLQNEFEKVYDNKENDRASLEKLQDLGAKLIPIELPDYPISALSFILHAEAAAAFDKLTHSNEDDLLVRQIANAWPNVFRQSRFIPAVEYIQANRVRYLLVEEMADILSDIDVYVAPSFVNDNNLLNNLTGHPAICVPNGFDENGGPTSISFFGRLYDEGTLLAVAKAYQDATDFHLRHPILDWVD